MKIFTYKSRAALTGIATLIVLSACSGAPEEKYQTVTLNGTVKLQAGPVPEGTINFRIFTLWSGEGDLRHPLGEIEDFQSDTANFTHTFEYPLHKGEGLAIHAWIDTDGDGVFCTPTVKTDPGGLAWTEETPGSEIDMAITLTDNCRNAIWFYPPKP
jgi:hypothetical protein